MYTTSRQDKSRVNECEIFNFNKQFLTTFCVLYCECRTYKTIFKKKKTKFVDENENSEGKK